MSRRHARAVSFGWLALALARGAAADPNDGIYGRLDGDLDLSLSVFAGARDDGGAVVGGSARALYLFTTGLYATFQGEPSGQCRRCLGIGTTLRPLFLARWGSDLEHGPAFVDLAVDSLAIDLGALFALSAETKTAVGVELGLGFELPLLGRAAGPFIGARGALEWPTIGSRATAVATLGLSFHAVADAHLVDVGDALLR